MGKYLYGEWLKPIYHYIITIKKNEITFDIVLPIIIAFISSILYFMNDFVLLALIKLRDLLPSSLSILIGFTIMCLTILVTGNSKSIDIIKEQICDKRVIGKNKITIYRWLLILFAYTLLIEIFTLILVFLSAFIIPLVKDIYIGVILLWIETYLLCHILFIMIRAMTNLYLLFRCEDK